MGLNLEREIGEIVELFNKSSYESYLVWNLFEDNVESMCKYLRRYYPRDFNNYLGYINNTVLIKQSDKINVCRAKYNHEG